MFTDILNQYIFVTKDNGTTIVPYKVNFVPSEVIFHPLDANVLLIYDTEDSERKVSTGGFRRVFESVLSILQHQFCVDFHYFLHFWLSSVMPLLKQ